MKVQVISDLHLEFGSTELTFDKADVLIIAGDLHTGTKGVEWIVRNVPGIPVVYVLGNHEYYKGAYPKTLFKIQEAAQNTNVIVLENESIQIEDLYFHGATLWTDFELFGNARYYGSLCQERMNDYKKIRRTPSYSKLRSIDTYGIHKRSLHWLKETLEKHKGQKNIVVTHHAPSINSIPENFRQDSVSSAYASNLEAFIKDYTPNFWIHGHIHSPKRYFIDQTEVICNPHGYSGEKYNGFEKELYISI